MKEPNKFILDRLKKIKNIRVYAEKKKILRKSKIRRIKRDKTFKKHIIRKWNKSAIKIQSLIRGYLNFIKFKCQNNKFINNTNLMYTPINKIDNLYLVYHKNFFFDIRELKKNFENNYYINPYDRIKFPDFFIAFVNRKISNFINKNISLAVETFNLYNYSSYITYIFNRISEYGTYPNLSIYLNYTTDDLFYFVLYISNFKIIFDNMNLDLFDNICEGVDYFKDEEDYKKNIGLLIEQLVFHDDDNNDLRSMVISNCLYIDIKKKYFDKNYLNEDYEISYIDSDDSFEN